MADCMHICICMDTYACILRLDQDFRDYYLPYMVLCHFVQLALVKKLIAEEVLFPVLCTSDYENFCIVLTVNLATRKYFGGFCL